MNITITKAISSDLPGLETLFEAVHDALEAETNHPGWRRGIYPVKADAEAGVREGTLYVAKEKEAVVGCLILNHKEEQGYNTVKWLTNADAERVYVLHTFMVHPRFRGTRLSQMLLQFAEEQARHDGMMSVRLDVYERNHPAIRLYEKCGFHYLATVDLGLQAFQLNYFRIYEKIV